MLVFMDKTKFPKNFKSCIFIIVGYCLNLIFPMVLLPFAVKPIYIASIFIASMAMLVSYLYINHFKLKANDLNCQIVMAECTLFSSIFLYFYIYIVLIVS